MSMSKQNVPEVKSYGVCGRRRVVGGGSNNVVWVDPDVTARHLTVTLLLFCLKKHALAKINK